MSTGKRLAKRSILGTRVAIPGEDGLYHPGVIQAVKTPELSTSGQTSRYTVRLDGNRKLREHPESDIIGPGFAGLTGIKLRPGQVVYVTYCNREMQGSVVCHRPNVDQVIIRLLNGGPEVKKKLEEVRLLESRKSARLIGHGNTDFSKLADFNIVHERKRLNSETSDMSSGTTSGRKRRGSETLSDSSCDEGELDYSPWSSSSERAATPVMSECTAAMVLMNLSHAQLAASASKEQQRMMQFLQQDTQNCPQDLSTTSSLLSSTTVPSSASSPSIQDGSSSPLSSTSGASSLGSSWTPRGQQPSPPTNGVGGSNRATPISTVSQQQVVVANLTEAEALLQLSHFQESDEGIVSDQSSVADPEDPRSKNEHVRIIYQCTWPRCGIKMDICSDMERHVRSKHLMKHSSDEDLEGEEEFYYTEIEVPFNDLSVLIGPASSVSTSHLQRPRVAPPLLQQQQQTPPTQRVLFSTSAPPTVLQALPSNLADHMDMARPPHENPEYNFAHHGNGDGHASSPMNLQTQPRPSPAHSQPPRRLPAHLASYPPPPPPPFSSMSAAVPIAIPVTTLAFASSAPPAHSNSHPHLHHSGKYIRLSPKPASNPATAPYNGSPAATASAIAAAAASNNLLSLQQQQQQQQQQHQPQPQQPQQGGPLHPQQVKSSPIRRPRGDAKKCRKVYGMDHRDLWCTQCKWKKACTRFGEAA